MAPATANVPAHESELADKLKVIAQNLYNLYVQAGEYAGPSSENAMKTELSALVQNLVEARRLGPTIPIQFPPEVIHYVENVRNPDIYKREFVELLQKWNQRLKGKQEAFGFLFDTLAKDIADGIPELREDVAGIARNAGKQFPAEER